MTTGTHDDLTRFVDAQASVYPAVLAELQRGRKTGHWMWFVFPQIAGLGTSPTARFYAIPSIDEASAYLLHPLLSDRLLECTQALLQHSGIATEAIMGPVDAVKLRSSMTLFEHAAEKSGLHHAASFGRCLDMFFAGDRDPVTLGLLASPLP